MSLTELLIQAKSKKAQQFLFVVGSEPRARINATWSSLRKSPALVTEWNLLQQSLLTSRQREVLETEGLIIGESAIENTRIGFSFFQNETTMKALLHFDSESGTKSELSLPSGVYESCLRMKGLFFLSGPGDAGQMQAVHRLLQKMNEERSFVCSVFSAQVFPAIREDKATFIYQSGSVEQQSEQAILAGSDVVVFIGMQSPSQINKAIELAERGLFVIVAMAAPSLGNMLRQILSVALNEGGELGTARLAEVMSLAVGQYALTGLGGEQVHAHEVLLMKPQVRALLEKKDVRGIEQVLSEAADNSGLVNLNQSLLQHLIRRRIDIKTAFEASHNPDSLDQLLKKVGI